MEKTSKNIKLKRFLKKIKRKVIKLMDKLKSSSKQFKILLIMWLTIILIVILLFILCSNNNKNIKNHKKMEKAIAAASLLYVEENEIYPTVYQKLKLNMQTLVESEVLDEDDVTDKSCEGYSIIYYDESEEKYQIDSYLKCDKYVTDGYKNK